jgi:midasin
MHTDVQEYLGSYIPDASTGKLTFQEGVLVEAVRKGYWVILDELNLAPSEVLEALNRLLDDNRELHIVET